MTVDDPPVSRTAPRNDLSVDELRLRPDGAGRVSVDPRRAGWRYLSFDLVPIGGAPVLVPVALLHEVAIVVLSGRDVNVADGGRHVATLGGRDDPFGGLPWAVWMPEAVRLELTSTMPGLVAVARAPRSGRHGVASSSVIVSPADVEVEVRGAGSATRQVNHIIAPGFPADRLLLVEVLTPSGNWSSWPPHKHDVDEMPAEAVLEEVYAYQFRRPEAWGVQRLYRPPGSPAGADRDGVWAVRHGDVVLVTDGYHPFVATHGDDAYYLNALAGDRRTMACSFDPALAHVRDDWTGMAPDPRVPLVAR